MTSNVENQRSHQQKPSHQRKGFAKVFSNSVIDKENIRLPEQTVPSVSRQLFPTPETSSAKPKRHLDNNKNNNEQALRPKGLQVDQGNKQAATSKNCSQPLSETLEVRPVARTFSIYDENKKNAEPARKLSYRRAAEPTRRSPDFRVELHTSTDLRENIKEVHKQSHTLKTSPQDAYDTLSIEAAYNIEYMTEYVRFQLEINEKKSLSQSFLKKSITPDQRRLIVKYLIRSTSYYRYPSFVLHQAVKIFDFYIDTVDLALREMQISALAALWIALKKDLTSGEIPEASVIMKLGGSIFDGSNKLLIEREKNMLMSLNFEVSFADPFSMLALYTVMIEQVRTLEAGKVKELYYCGCYLMDLSLLHEKTLSVPAMHLAAISAEIALVIYMSSDEDLKEPRWSYWRSQVFKVTPIIEKYRLPEPQMNNIRNILLQKAVQSDKASTDYHVVYKKYNTKRYGLVSKFLLSKISTLYINKITNPAYASSPIFF